MGSDLCSSTTCHHFAPVLLLLYESIPDVVLERFSVNHGRRSWRVSQLADRQNSLSLPRVCIARDNCAFRSLRNCACAGAISGTIYGLSARSMDPRFAQFHPWIVRIHAMRPTYISMVSTTILCICKVAREDGQSPYKFCVRFYCYSPTEGVAATMATRTVYLM